MGGHFSKNVVIAVSLLAAGFLAAWLRYRPHLGTEGAFTDGARTIEIERVEELRYAVWDAPRPMEGEVNSPEAERSPAISPDGRYVVFVVGERGLGTDLWLADLDGRGIGMNPRPLVGVNSAGDEVAPAFASDGALLFASNRPGGSGGLDLWRAGYDRGVFDAAEWIDGNLNTAADETDPASVPGSDTLVFASNRERADEPRARSLSRDFDLFRATVLPTLGSEATAWDVEPLDELNSTYDEREPSLSVDGRAFLFASDREGGAGGFDLYRAARTPVDYDGEDAAREWLAPRALEGVNSAASERSPRPAADGFELLFARGEAPVAAAAGAEAEGELQWDIWRATSREIVRTPGKPVGWREIVVLVALLVLALLAALAKRWRGLDVIYKAFLISLLIHLALLFWAKEVVPESPPVELREGDANRVRVRLVEDPNSLRVQRNQERGGEIEAARSLVEAAAEAPTSEPTQAETRDVESQPDAQTPLERSEAVLAAAPERLSVREAERTAETRPVEAPLRAAAEAFERFESDVPAMTVDAARTEASRSESESVEVARSERVTRSTGAALPTVEAPSAAPLERSQARSEEARTTPARREVVVDRATEVASTTADDRAPKISGPASEFERKTADAREADRPMDVRAAGAATLVERAEGELGALSAESPRAVVETEATASEPTLAPATASQLSRSRTSGDLAAAPRRTAIEAVPSAPRSSSDPSRTVRVADAAGDTELVRTETESAPEFNALAGADAGAVRYDRAQTARTGAPDVTPTIGEVALSEFTPTEVAPLARSRGEAPKLAPSLPAPSARPTPERSETDGRAAGLARDLEVAAPEAAEVRVAVDTTAPERDLGADLAPTDLSAPLRRSRSDRDDPAPGLLASGGPGADVVTSAPAPIAFELDAPTAPSPVASLVTPDRGRDEWERTPYQSRSGQRKIAALKEFGGGEETERAVESGLAYLAKRQRNDGRWGRKEVDEKYGQPMVGKTGLALLAFMGAGHTQVSDSMYSGVVRRGLEFLVDSQVADSGHFGNTSSYGHAIATYAIGEAYALSHDDSLRRPLELAVQQIIDHQMASRDPLLDGGWSYFYGNDRQVDRWPRASVSVWQVMALESAKLGGVSVPGHVFKRARSFLVNTWDPSMGAFRYSHDPSRLRSDYPLLPGSTPAAMFALSLLGADIGEAQFAPAREFVLERAPEKYEFTGDDDFVYKAQGNLYFWYYGTLAMFRAGGDDWKRWNVAMKDTLVPAQESDGSWRPISIYAGYAQDTDGDRTYTTAMNVLALEVYYRYFTPLLKVE